MRKYNRRLKNSVHQSKDKLHFQHQSRMKTQKEKKLRFNTQTGLAINDHRMVFFSHSQRYVGLAFYHIENVSEKQPKK